MTDPKPFASLTAGLLARKGNARPAMRRQPHFAAHGAVPLGHDDLGWNDMGYDVDPARQIDDVRDGHVDPARGLSPMHHHGDVHVADAHGLDAADMHPINDTVEVITPFAEPEVRRQMQTLAKAITVNATQPDAKKAGKGASRAQAGTRGKYAFTLRLDPDRHLRLRLMSAASKCSTQQLLVAMIDEYLGQRPEIDSLVARLPAQTKAASKKGK